jgi:hypothetical protein
VVDDLLKYEEQGEARRRAGWALAVLAFAAVIIVGLVLFVGGTSKAPKQAALGSVPAPSSSAGPQTQSTRVSPPASTSTSSPRAPVSTPSTSSIPTSTTSCSAPGCTLAGGGGLLTALNALRAKHSLPPVTGALTSAARRCAAANGDTPSCPGSYFWEPVTTRSGSEVLAKIAAQPNGPSFLLAAQLKSVSIGWVHSGSWKCALIAG